LRGIACVQLPTTLLAMVDSSVGGKTGVNHAIGKNLIGAFWQPVFVGAELKFLETLPDEELRSGLAEVIKYGVIADTDLFAYLEQHIEAALGRDPRVLTHLVAQSCRIKAGVVARDEREGGVRAILNYGHTFGHAAEALTGFALRHGEAVAMGMVAAARLAQARGLTGPELPERIEALLQRASLPTRLPRFAVENYWAAMRSDKKAGVDAIRFVLPEQLGRVSVYDDLSPAQVASCLELSMGERS
jgi:3-dehydroquinate synthetase